MVSKSKVIFHLCEEKDSFDSLLPLRFFFLSILSLTLQDFTILVIASYFEFTNLHPKNIFFIKKTQQFKNKIKNKNEKGKGPQ